MRSAQFVLVAVGVLSPRWAGADFVAIHDHASQTFQVEHDHFNARLSISRDAKYSRKKGGHFRARKIDHTTVSVSRRKLPSGQSKIILTKRIKASLRILGYYPKKNVLLAAELQPRGHSTLIAAVHVVGNKRSTRIGFGSRASQYVRPSPDGRYCVIVFNHEVEAVDLKSQQKRTVLKVRKSLEDKADPGIGPVIGGNENLSGRYMEIVWETKRAGRLLVKDQQGLLQLDRRFRCP